MQSVTDSENVTSAWPTVALRLLSAVRDRSPEPGRQAPDGVSVVRYEPAVWFRQRPTPRRRQRWSRWTRRLAAAGLLARITEPTRDRVVQVQLTAEGRRFVDGLDGQAPAVDFDAVPLREADLPRATGCDTKAVATSRISRRRPASSQRRPVPKPGSDDAESPAGP